MLRDGGEGRGEWAEARALRGQRGTEGQPSGRESTKREGTRAGEEALTWGTDGEGSWGEEAAGAGRRDARGEAGGRLATATSSGRG